MDARAQTDFSIERLLSTEVGLKPQVVRDTCPEEGPPRPDPVAPLPVPVPLLVPVCLQYRGFTDRFCPCAAALHHPNFPGFYPALYQNFVQNRAEPPQHSQAPPRPRQKTRMRTVFTDAQSRQLEALFHVTDYPTAEARAELSARTGLTEETVRVWFKNRRARRKRQRGDPEVRPRRLASRRRDLQS